MSESYVSYYLQVESFALYGVRSSSVIAPFNEGVEKFEKKLFSDSSMVEMVSRAGVSL